MSKEINIEEMVNTYVMNNSIITIFDTFGEEFRKTVDHTVIWYEYPKNYYELMTTDKSNDAMDEIVYKTIYDVLLAKFENSTKEEVAYFNETDLLKPIVKKVKKATRTPNR